MPGEGRRPLGVTMARAFTQSRPDYEWRSALPEAHERLLELCKAADPWGPALPGVTLEWLPRWMDEVPANRPAALCLSREPAPLLIGLSKAQYGEWGETPAEVVLSGLADLATTTSHELQHHRDPYLNAIVKDDPAAWQRWIHRDAFNRIEQVALNRLMDAGLLVQVRWPKLGVQAPAEAMPVETPDTTPIPVPAAASGAWPSHHVLAGLSIQALFRLFNANPNGWTDNGVQVRPGEVLQWPGSCVVWGCAGRFTENTLWLDQIEPRSSERREVPLAVAQAMVVTP